MGYMTSMQWIALLTGSKSNMRFVLNPESNGSLRLGEMQRDFLETLLKRNLATQLIIK